MISVIYSIDKVDDEVSVEAVIEDMVVVSPATFRDPEEYGPALCRATFYLEENEILPRDEDQLIDYLESMDLNWEVVPKEDLD